MDFNVFDINFNRLGVIDIYDNCEINGKYQDHDDLRLTLDSSDSIYKILISEDFRILTKITEPNKGYIIESIEYDDVEKTKLLINAKSLSSMIGWRAIEGQQRYTGKLESVIKSFVKYNCIEPKDSNRIIPNLILSPDTGIDIDADETYTNSELDVSLWEICKKYNASYEVLMDHMNKKYVFNVFIGADRSSIQTDNDIVIFSKEFDNVITQSYTDDLSNYKSTVYITSNEDENNVGSILYKVGNEVSGYNRREIILDAANIRKEYTDENDNKIVMTDAQFKDALKEYGTNKVSEYKRIQTFQSDVEVYSRYTFGVHYFLGDIITNRNDEIGVINHTRVVSSRETYSNKGYELSLDFGVGIPTLIDKIKRKVK